MILPFKKQIFCFMFSVLCCMQLSAQTTITIPSANPEGTGASTAVYRKPLGTNRAYERSAMIYKHSDIGQTGTISAIRFFCDSLNVPGNSVIRVFVKEVPDTVMTATTVAAIETGATLVYDDTIFVADFVQDTWTEILLTTPFVHGSTQNIMVIVETNSGGTAGTDINPVSKGFRYFTTAGNTLQYWQSPTGNGTPPAGPGTLSPLRPNVQFDISPLPPCTVPPVAGVTLASNDSVCAGDIISLTLNGADLGSGITYQWISSVDGINWAIMTGDTNATTTATISSDSVFACILTCSGISDTAQAVSISLNSFYTCYCNDNLGGNCTSAIDSVAIAGTTLDNGPTGCNVTYTQYPQSGNTTAVLQQGINYTISTRYTGDARTSLWIDYNHNGSFDTNEWTQLSTTSVAGAEINSSLVIPFSALTGPTGMRIRSRAAAGQNDSTTACSNFGTGETEDYIIDIIAASACVAPPDAGIAVSSADSVCAGNPVSLSLSGNSTGSGLTYQWISSSDGLTWQDVSGATGPLYNPLISADSVFACVITCTGVSDTSASVTITLKSFYGCYCTDNLGGNCTSAIDSLAITGTSFVNGPSGCTNAYSSYPASGSTTVTLQQGQAYIMASRFTGDARASLWIDYDHSGTFDNNEWTQLCTTSTPGTEILTGFVVSTTAQTGFTGMRIRSRGTTGQNDSTSACATFGSGETEDYLIEIMPALPCLAPPTAGTATASADSVCAGETVSFSLSGNSTGAGLAFQWLSSPDGLNWSIINGATQAVYSAVINSDSAFTCVVTCSGIPDTANVLEITLKSFLYCYCSDNLGGDCNTNATAIDSVAVDATTLVNGPTGCSASFYTAFPPSGNTTGDLVQGQVHTFITRYTGNVIASLWIDFNQNGDFEAGEWTQLATTTTAGTDVSTNVQVPLSAITGLTGMRVRTRASGSQNNGTSACATFGSGETEDYIVNILPAPPCTAPPVPGIAVASNDTVCPVDVVTFSLNGISGLSGQSFQWISSTDGTTWNNISGANADAYVTTLDTNSTLACIVTCSGVSDTSTAVTVIVNPFLDCYCTQNIGGNCAASAIDSLAIAGTTLNTDTTGCAPTFYTLYTDTGNFTAGLIASQFYDLQVKFNGDVRAAFWIDYDHNGNYDTYEYVPICSTSVPDSTISTVFVVPSNALTGLTGMRVRSRVTAGTMDSTSACATFGTGETEDFRITILPAVISVQENTRPVMIDVFPNPAEGQFTVLSQTDIRFISLTDISGRTIPAEYTRLSANRLTVDVKAGGLFFVKIVDELNRESFRKIIVK